MYTKIPASQTVIVLLSLFLTMAVTALGCILPVSDHGAVFIAVIAGALLLVYAVQSVLAKRFIGGLQKMSVKESYELGLKFKEDIEKDYAKAEKSLGAVYRVICVYVAILAAAVLALAYFNGVTLRTQIDVYDEAESLKFAVWFIPAGCVFLLGCFSAMGIMRAVFGGREQPYRNSGLILPPADYPSLYAVIERARVTAGCRKKIVAVLSGDGIAISESGGVAYVSLNPYECSLLTREELYNVMLHEFAHIIHKDTARSRKYNDFANGLGGREDFTPFLNFLQFAMFGYAFSKIGFAFETYSFIASRYHEINADEFVKARGDRQLYIDATAKGVFWALFDDMPCPELNYFIFESETPCEDYAEVYWTTFKKYAAANETRWRENLQKELPARIASHPTLRMRMENMGVIDFDVSAVDPNAAYAAEGEALRKKLSEMFTADVKDNYAEIRRTNFTERKRAMTEYDADVAAGKSIGDAAKLNAASAFFSIDSEKTYDIAMQVLANDPDSGYAHYYAGLVLFWKDDDECVGHFYAAAKSRFSLTDAALERIGAFALGHGRQDILDEYRNNCVGLAQNSVDERKKFEIKSADETVASDMEKSKAEEIVDYMIRKCGDGKIDKIYTAKRKAKGDGEELFIYAIGFAADVSYPERYEIYGKVLTYLDSRAENFNLFYADVNDKIVQKIKNVKDSLVYPKA